MAFSLEGHYRLLGVSLWEKFQKHLTPSTVQPQQDETSINILMDDAVGPVSRFAPKHWSAPQLKQTSPYELRSEAQEETNKYQQMGRLLFPTRAVFASMCLRLSCFSIFSETCRLHRILKKIFRFFLKCKLTLIGARTLIAQQLQRRSTFSVRSFMISSHRSRWREKKRSINVQRHGKSDECFEWILSTIMVKPLNGAHSFALLFALSHHRREAHREDCVIFWLAGRPALKVWLRFGFHNVSDCRADFSHALN